MPFGREAGHFKDITALVATKDPNRIPLAYMYREGDYATRVDIYILNWRVWEDSHFPPPDDLANRQDCSGQMLGQGNPQPNPQPNSFSSSSSNGAASDPTIDLSAWSPRSHQATVPTEELRTNRIPQSERGETQDTETLQLQGLKLIHPLVFSDRVQIVVHRKHRTHATENPHPNRDPTRVSMLLYTYLLPNPAPNPITITLLCSLRTINCQNVILGAAQKIFLVSLSHKKSDLQEMSQKEALEVFEEMPQEAPLISMHVNHAIKHKTLCTNTILGQTGSPSRPKTIVSPTLPTSNEQTHSQRPKHCPYPPPSTQAQHCLSLSFPEASGDSPPQPQHKLSSENQAASRSAKIHNTTLSKHNCMP